MIFGKIFLGCPVGVLGYPLGYHDRKLLIIKDGGGCSPERTALWPNSLLTGKNTGNFADIRPV